MKKAYDHVVVGRGECPLFDADLSYEREELARVYCTTVVLVRCADIITICCVDGIVFFCIVPGTHDVAL